jgi:hypothetical protein
MRCCMRSCTHRATLTICIALLVSNVLRLEQVSATPLALRLLAAATICHSFPPQCSSESRVLFRLWRCCLDLILGYLIFFSLFSPLCFLAGAHLRRSRCYLQGCLRLDSHVGGLHWLRGHLSFAGGGLASRYRTSFLSRRASR